MKTALTFLSERDRQLNQHKAAMMRLKEIEEAQEQQLKDVSQVSIELLFSNS